MCSSNRSCCICFNNIPKSYPTLSCGHKVHPKCMRRWNNSCPLCRTEVDIIPNTRSIKNAKEIYNNLDLIISPLKLNCYNWKFNIDRTEELANNICIGIYVLSDFVWEHRRLLRRNDLLISNLKKRIPVIVQNISNIKGNDWHLIKKYKKEINRLKTILTKI